MVTDEQFVSTHESFVRETAGREDDPTEGLNTNERASYAIFFSRCQRRYLAVKEKEANESMMALVNGAITVSAAKNISKGFGRSAYERVRDLKNIVDFRACHSLVMVGSGAFPATLFWLRDHFPHMRYVGLDIDPRCVEMATLLTTAMGMNNVQFQVCNGNHFDFDGANVVYVANCLPKPCGTIYPASLT
jgi:hypothetical protein